jgi:hypothetical protein
MAASVSRVLAFAVLFAVGAGSRRRARRSFGTTRGPRAAWAKFLLGTERIRDRGASHEEVRSAWPA